MLIVHPGRIAAGGGAGKGKLTARLEWELRHRDDSQKAYSKTVAKWLERRGMEAPNGLREPEPIHPDLIPIWRAWHDLGVSRPSGMVASGVPWAEMSAYCEDHGIRGPLRLRWIRLLRAMDLTYLAETGRVKEERKRGSSRSRD